MKTMFRLMLLLVLFANIIGEDTKPVLVEGACYRLLYYEQTVRCECRKDEHPVVQIYENKFLVICPPLANNYTTLLPYLRGGEIVKFWTIPDFAQAQGIQGMEVERRDLGPYLKPTALASK